MTNFQIGWTAGILDGEASIELARCGTSTGHLIVRIQVNNTDFRIPETLQKLWGGKVMDIYVGGNYRDQRRWYVSSQEAVAVLELTQRHLISKAEHASICIEFQKTIGSHGDKISNDNIIKREQLRAIIEGLNKRGRR